MNWPSFFAGIGAAACVVAVAGLIAVVYFARKASKAARLWRESLSRLEAMRARLEAMRAPR